MWSFLFYTSYMTNANLLHELEPTIEQAYQEHMTTARGQRQPLFPTTLLAQTASEPTRNPLEYGPILAERLNDHLSSFETEYDVDVKPVLAATFLINLLTEDNLPYYTAINLGLAQDSEAMATWVREWTTEEDAHGVLMRDYALLTGLFGANSIIEHDTYNTGRTAQLRSGTAISPTSLYHAFSYLPLQELLTKEAHTSLGLVLDSSGGRIMNRIGGDEHNHYEFYQKLLAATLAIDPDNTLPALAETYQQFAMPGKEGIPDFEALEKLVALAGIFDAVTIARAKARILQAIEVEKAEPVTQAAKKAQEKLVVQASDQKIERVERAMERFRRNIPIPAEGPAPFILGHTIGLKRIETVTGMRTTGLERLMP